MDKVAHDFWGHMIGTASAGKEPSSRTLPLDPHAKDRSHRQSSCFDRVRISYNIAYARPPLLYSLPISQLHDLLI